MTPQMKTTSPTAAPTYYRTTNVAGLNIAYREAGDPSHPKLVLLHGFPASSHQYRDLIPALSNRFHVIAPDYPGFGHSDMPDPASYHYSFDKLSEVMEAFLADLPNAEMHQLAAGHFAVDDSLNEIAEGMHRFYRNEVAGSAQ